MTTEYILNITNHVVSGILSTVVTEYNNLDDIHIVIFTDINLLIQHSTVFLYKRDDVFILYKFSITVQYCSTVLLPQ